MNEVELPALLGDRPATFLAALGVLGIVSYELNDDGATLSWPDPRGPAVLTSATIVSLDDLAGSLSEVAVRVKEAGRLLPGSEQAFPPRKEGKGTDPSRSVPFSQGQVWSRSEQTDSPTGSPPWLRSIFATNSAKVERDSGLQTLVRHPIFDAGPGTVSMSTTLSSALDEAVEKSGIFSALTTGRRVPGSIGGYLDWRADRNASQAASSKDKTTSFGDPALTWLGLMSVRLTTVIADGEQATCGLTPKLSGRELRKALVWPVWNKAFRAEEVEVLLCHSAIARTARAATVRGGAVKTGKTRDSSRALAALGVDAVFASPRLSKGNNDGAYGPPNRLWPE